MSASNRSLLFLLGLVLGLLIGAGFFIFKMDDLLKKIDLFSSSRDTLIIQQQNVSLPEEESKTEIKKNNEQKDTSKKTMTSAEALSQKYSSEASIENVMAEADSLLLLQEGSHIKKDTLETVVVRKDEFLGTKKIKVVNFPQNESENSSDSLLEKISGIKDANKNSDGLFKVEFWQSPINYKGYKMTKNKIALFGVHPGEHVYLFYFEEAIFMEHNQAYYKLLFTDDFKQFEKINDPSLIAELDK